jgi:hypothetical protein
MCFLYSLLDMIPLLPSVDVSLYSILNSGVLLLRIRFGVRSPSTDWVAKAAKATKAAKADTVIILNFIILVYVYLYGFIIYIG